MPNILTSPYSVKNYKTFRGHDDQGFQLVLYKNNKKLGEVTYDGWGGEFNYFISNSDMDDLRTYAKSLDPEVLVDGYVLPHSPDSVVEDALDRQLEILNKKSWQRKLNNASKTATLFVLDGEDFKKEGFRTVNQPASEQVFSYLKKQYPNNTIQYWDIVTKSLIKI